MEMSFETEPSHEKGDLIFMQFEILQTHMHSNSIGKEMWFFV